MRNYIRAELYRNFNRLYFWLFTGFLGAFELLVFILMRAKDSSHVSMTVLFEVPVFLIGLPVYLVVVFIDMITAEEQKNLTLRNTVSFGLSRTKMILSKMAATTILAFSSAILLLAVMFGTGLLLFGVGSNFPGNLGQDLLRLLCAAPLWFSAIAIGTLIASASSNNTIFTFIYLGIYAVLPKVIQLLELVVSRKFKAVEDLLPTSFLNPLSREKASNGDLKAAVLAGVIYSAVFLIINIIYINKKEIK